MLAFKERVSGSRLEHLSLPVARPYNHASWERILRQPHLRSLALVVSFRAISIVSYLRPDLLPALRHLVLLFYGDTELDLSVELAAQLDTLAVSHGYGYSSGYGYGYYPKAVRAALVRRLAGLPLVPEEVRFGSVGLTHTGPML